MSSAPPTRDHGAASRIAPRLRDPPPGARRESAGHPCRDWSQVPGKTLARAIGDLGRLAKTLYLLVYVDDENYRRRIITQLNRQEGRHSLARTIFHGQRGVVRQKYREGQEDQLNALGLVVNVVVLWNTIYMNAVLEHLRRGGTVAGPEDVGRLSPIEHQHVNFMGKYSFALANPVARGELRQLRDPAESVALA